MKRYFFIVSFFATTIAAKAQRPETAAWLAVQVPVNFSKHWQWHNDAGYRTLGTSVKAFQYLFRTGFQYRFNEQWSSAAGVAFFFSRTSFVKSDNEFGRESRFWEEINYQRQFNKKFQSQLRFRTEQRFFSATISKTAFTAFRFRIRASLTENLAGKWSLQLADEFMEQVIGQKTSFDQNRAIVSGIYQINPTTQLQGGYMWLLWPKGDQHIVTIGFIKNISVHAD